VVDPVVVLTLFFFLFSLCFGDQACMSMVHHSGIVGNRGKWPEVGGGHNHDHHEKTSLGEMDIQWDDGVVPPMTRMTMTSEG
jgi:hypothetical protein